MPLPVVAIAVEDNRLPADAGAAIVASCARVSGAAHCVREGDPLSPAARYLAVVQVSAGGKLHVALHARSDQALQAERDLVFVSSSYGSEHWNSAGLVIAALVADAEPPAAETRASTPLVHNAQQPTAHAAPGVWVQVDISGVATPGFNFDPWRVGAETKLAFGSPRSAFYPVLALRWSTASGRVDSRALDAALGAGARLIHLEEDKVVLRLELSAVSDTLLVSATTREGAQQSFRNRLGVRVGLRSSLRLAAPLHAVFGAEATWLSHRAAVEIDGQRLGAEPRYLPGFTVGLSLAF
jgi:hypothetical protein